MGWESKSKPSTKRLLKRVRMVLDTQTPVQVGHIPPSPHAGDDHHSQAEVAATVPVKVLFQESKKLVKGSIPHFLGRFRPGRAWMRYR
jgi:hypothetical protein